MRYAREDLLRRLPFGERFLFIDEAEVAGERAVARKAISGEESFLKGHFPDFPCMPGTHTIEIMGQAALLLVEPDEAHDVVMYRIADARFFSPITPPATIIVRLAIERREGNKTFLRAVAAVGDEEKASVDFWVARVPKVRFRR